MIPEFSTWLKYQSEWRNNLNIIVECLKNIPTSWGDSKFIDGYSTKYAVMCRKKDNRWRILGINVENTIKEIEIDLSFVSHASGIVIDKNEKGFQ